MDSVSEADYWQQDRDADEACARGEHTFTVVDFFGVDGRWHHVLVCEDCR